MAPSERQCVSGWWLPTFLTWLTYGKESVFVAWKQQTHADRRAYRSPRAGNCVSGGFQMYRVISVGLAAFVATAAQAADQIVPEQSGYNWSGFYVGAGVGAGGLVHELR